MTEKRLCTNCKHSRGLGYDFWCGEGHIKYEKYLAETDCPYFEVMDLQDNDFNNTENDSTNSRNEKRFMLTDFDSEVEMLEKINEQHETITDLEEKEIELGRNYLIKLEFEQKVKDTLQRHYKLYTNMAVELRHDKYSNGTCHTVLEVLEEIADELGIDLQ